MERIESLKAQALYRHCDPEQFQFKTSAELDDLQVSIGQARAVEAVEFGTGIRREGYNLFAAGPTGTGKFKMVSDFLRQKAAAEPTPSDWCYVNRFDDPQKPCALELPPKLEEIISRLLEKDRGLRYQSAADLRSDPRKRESMEYTPGRTPAACPRENGDVSNG